ncbi:MAG: alpha/beta fold hydrolase [Rhodobacteraceae bacterium]|nr:alpha/beta fold hydrolase [Paracoccaceae bacterium]
MSRPSGPHAAPASGGTAKQAVVFLHGYGASGDDLIGLAPYFARALPDAAFYSPHAPEPWEGGFFGGRQWFSLAGYDPDLLRHDGPARQRLDGKILAGAENAAPVLNAFLDDVLSHHGLAPDKLALVGFSQGTMMALHVGLRRPKRLAGIVGFSGAIAAPDRLPAEIKSRPPIILIHGAADPVVPVEALADVKNALRDSNVEFSAHVIPGLQHGIDDQGAALAAKFLQENLA